MLAIYPLKKCTWGRCETTLSAVKWPASKVELLHGNWQSCAVYNLAARVWRDESDKPWIDTAPLIQLPNWDDAKRPYPLSWDEQRALFKALPDHLHRMALFKINTGTREQEVCGLRWDWEVQIRELGVSVFVLPGIPQADWA